jgi:hypothetical protein
VVLVVAEIRSTSLDHVFGTVVLLNCEVPRAF